MKIVITESQLSELIKLDIEEEYPVGWDIEEFKKLRSYAARVRYCNEKLKKLGSGSSRIAYMVDNEKVLKLAKNVKGLAQNEMEIQWGNDRLFSHILAKVFEYDKDNLWVEMELARKVTPTKFTQLVGAPINQFEYYLTKTYNDYTGKKVGWNIAVDDQYVEALEKSEFVADVIDFIINTDSPLGDYGRLSSYGIVLRNGVETLVIVDYGLSTDVYDTHYKKR